jgi:hypothetical protein
MVITRSCIRIILNYTFIMSFMKENIGCDILITLA